MNRMAVNATARLGQMALVSACLLLAGCATQPADELAADLSQLAGSTLSTNASDLAGAEIALQDSRDGLETSPPEDKRAEEASVEPKIMRGSDRVVKLPRAEALSPVTGGPVSLSFEQASITEVVHAVLGDILGLDYTIHQPIAGDVTLHTRKPLPRSEVLAVLETILQTRGLALAKDAQAIYHVGRPDALKGVAPVLRRREALPAGESLVIVPLEHVGAAEMVEILKPLAPPTAFVRVDTARNLLLLSGSRNQIAGWTDIVDTFDVDLLAGMSVGLFPLEHASVEDVASALKLIASGAPEQRAGSVAAQAAGRQPEGVASLGVQGAAAAAEVVGGSSPLGGLVKVLPIENLNAILVVTPRAAYLDKAREWIEKLDRPDADGGSTLYVYPVQNGSAEHLAGLLNSVFGGGGSVTSAARDDGVAQGLASTSSASGSASASTGSGLIGSQSARSGSAFGSRKKSSKSTSNPAGVALGDDVRVVADTNQNALLIFAPRSEYLKIESALRKLDVAAAQVLIEASIVEVTLRDNLQYGLQWFFTNNVKGSGWNASGVLSTSASGTIESGGSGFTYSITNPLGDIAAKLRLLADKSLINVISSPSLMVLDNQTAEIQVGDQQPVKTSSTASSTTGITTESIEYRDTGVHLSVTPSINAGDMITMELEQSITDIGDQDEATGQRSFLERAVSSKVAVRSGETIVLGGLIKNNRSTGRQGVPLLHDLPLIGNLFGTSTVNTDRTELIVMITPRVVRTERDIRTVGRELRERMKALDSLDARADGPRLLR
ncbi:MAG: type II secretion system secretin GspD [Rhodocyclaceae bacterium]|nr:type II secretion system secretin GspD [Rhodocyclaceae bacterium]